jgi:hypothetical protein
MSINTWIDKENVEYIHDGRILSLLKRRKSSHFSTTRMTLEDILLSEISQAQKDKCYIMSPICDLKKSDITETESRMVTSRG